MGSRGHGRGGGIFERVKNVPKHLAASTSLTTVSSNLCFV